MLPCVLALLIAAAPALAHQVVTSIWVEGDQIVGEVGFANGTKAGEATMVEVFGPDGTRLGAAFTDSDGRFELTPNQAVTHRFKADLGGGHAGEAVLDVSQLPPGLRRAQQSQGSAIDSNPNDATSNAASEPSCAELESLITRAVQHEVLPLRRELAAYKEKNDLQGILGGIGYICGIFGLLFFVYARRRLREQARVEPTEDGR